MSADSLNHAATNLPQDETHDEIASKVKPSHISKIKNNADTFFRLSDSGSESTASWNNRRTRIASSIGNGIIENRKRSVTFVEFGEENSERRKSHVSAKSEDNNDISQQNLKKSVLQISLAAIKSISAPSEEVQTNQLAQPKSVQKGSVVKLIKSIDVKKSARLLHLKSAPSIGNVDGTIWGAKSKKYARPTPLSKQVTPSTSIFDYDAECSLDTVKNMVFEVATTRQKRTAGLGNIGELLQRKLRSSVFDSVKIQIDNLDDFRPYFTYWVTSVQIVILIACLFVYGFAPIGIYSTFVSENVILPNLAIETVFKVEKDNIWIGLRRDDLIHLGGKYSPCMREEVKLKAAVKYNMDEEKNSACCIRKDGSGCVQTVKNNCDGILSIWKKWSMDNPGPDIRTSGSVCGQDPRYCEIPSSITPFEWPDDITKWPICIRSVKFNYSNMNLGSHHMKCQILGRPCCFGIQGQCLITTYDHCQFLRGFFHSEANLCSQINCFQEVCGMIPFANTKSPDQMYRIFTSIFLHAGLVHLLLTIIFQMWIMRDLEKLLGALRIFIIYIGSGMAGNLASCAFLPYQVEVGPSGAQFGIVACLLVEVIQSFQLYRHPYIALFKLILPIILLFILGLVPWFDNWAHIFGFFSGFLLAFSVMPYVTFGHYDAHRKLITVIVCIAAVIMMFVFLYTVFNYYPFPDCKWCIYFSCIPFTDEFCMEFELKNHSTYTILM